jgi:hypothetical protein
MRERCLQLSRGVGTLRRGRSNNRHGGRVDIRCDSETDNRGVKKISHGLLGKGSGNGAKEYAKRKATTLSRPSYMFFPAKQDCISADAGA